MSDSETSPNLNSNINEERPTPQFGYCEDGQIEKADSEGIRGLWSQNRRIWTWNQPRSSW